MAGPFDRIPGIDTDDQLPDEVRARLALNLRDTATPEGTAIVEALAAAAAELAPEDLTSQFIADQLSTAGTPANLALQAALDDALEDYTPGGGSATSAADLEYSGTAWPARGTAPGMRRWYSTKYPAAPAPPDRVVGDTWTRHPDAVG